MRLTLLSCLILGIALLFPAQGFAASADGVTTPGPASQVIYCYDRSRDTVARALASECRGKIVDEPEAEAIRERRNRQIMRAIAVPQQAGPEGTRLAAYGTAFYVDETGRLATNHHVVDGCKGVTIRTANGKGLPARVLAVDLKNDLALLQVDARSPAVAVFGEGAGLAGFVATVGYPNEGLAPIEPFITAGVLLRAGGGAAGDTLVIKADVHHGNSGGPIFDRYGLVIGVIKAKINTVRVYSETGRVVSDTGLGIGIPTILDFLRRNDTRYRVEKGGEVMNADQILERARSFVARADCWK